MSSSGRTRAVDGDDGELKTIGLKTAKSTLAECQAFKLNKC